MEDGVDGVDGADSIKEDPWWTSADRQARVLTENRRIRDNDIKPLIKLRQMLVGPHYGGGVMDASVEKPTNTTYGYYARVFSQVLGGDLTCMIDADFGSPEEPIALSYERAVNKTFEFAGGPEIMKMVLADMVCGYGAMLVTPPEEATTTIREHERKMLRHPMGEQAWDDAKAAPRIKAHEAGGLLTEEKPVIDASPQMPGLMYLSPQFFSYDRRAFTIAESEFVEYVTSHDINELIATARASDSAGAWHVDRLISARTSLYADHEAKLGGNRQPQGGLTDSTERGRIMITNLVVMRAKIEGRDPPANHNAVVYTLWSPSNNVESAIWVREPFYTFVPPWGPLVLFKQHVVGIDSVGFSVLTANKTKVEASDAIHAVAYKRIREYRSNPVFDVRDAADVAALEAALDGVPVAINGGERGLGYQNVIRGGLDPVIVGAIQYLDQRLAEDLGFSSAERGAAVGGNITATETTVAAQQTNAKILQFQKEFNEGASGVFRSIGWYIGHDARFVVRADFMARAQFHEAEALPFLGEVDAAEVGRRAAASRGSRGLTQGGDFSETTDFDFSELRFSINAQLQRAITPEQRREESAQLRAGLIQLMEVVVVFPHYNWLTELRQMELDYGRRGLVDAFRAEIASLKAQVQIESGQAEARMSPAGTGATRNQSGPTFGMAAGRPVGPQQSMMSAAGAAQEATGPQAPMAPQ